MAEAEPSAHPPHYPQGGTYADLLAWHLEYWGTRDDGNTTINGKPWEEGEFEEAFYGNSISETVRVSPRNWLGINKAPSAPNEANAKRIQSIIFGDNPVFADWRSDLDEARERSLKGKNQRTREFPNPPPVVKATASIPRLATHFMGRDDDVDVLANALASPEGPRAVLVQGGPGFGKTELTKAVALHDAVALRFGPRRYFVPLETAATADAMQDAVIRAIGGDPAQVFAVALQSLHGRDTLLVLDNLETPWEPTDQQQATEQTLADLAAVSGVAVLASFRGRASVGGARWQTHALEALSSSSANDLFASIAGQEVKDDPDLDSFITALGGIPLAIDLVARRAHGRGSLTPLWREWNRIGADFATHPRAGPGRLTSLHYSIELSLNALRSPDGDHPALRLFRFLGVLPDGLTDRDVNYLLGDTGFEAVEKLCHVGLAMERGDRIDILPPIRDHARFHYPPNKDDNARWTRQFIGSLYSSPAVGDPAATKNHQYLLESYHNFESAIMAAMDTRLVDSTVIRNFCEIAQMGFRSADSMLALANHFAGSWNRFAEATCYRYMASFWAERGEQQRAYDLYQRAVPIFEEWGDAATRIDCLFGLASIAEAQGDSASAKELARAVIGLSYLIEDDEWGEGDKWRSLAQISQNDNELTRACLYFELAVEKYEKMNDNRSLAICQNSWGQCLAKLNRHDEARGCFETARSRYTFLHNGSGIATSLEHLARLDRIDGNNEAAELRYREARDFYQGIGNALGMERCEEALNDLAAPT